MTNKNIDSNNDNLIIFIPLKFKAGIYCLDQCGKVEYLSQVNFTLNDTIINNYTILYYNKFYNIINDDCRDIYDIKFENINKEIIVEYNSDSTLVSIKFLTNSKNILFYKKYSIDDAEKLSSNLIDEFFLYSINNLNKNFIDEEVCNLFIDYYYDGSSIDIHIVLATTKERNLLYEKHNEENLQTPYINSSGDYSTRLFFSKDLMSKLECLMLSIRRDSLFDEFVILKRLSNELKSRLASANLQLNLSDDFEVIEPELYD